MLTDLLVKGIQLLFPDAVFAHVHVLEDDRSSKTEVYKINTEIFSAYYSFTISPP
ncbi:MAG TPA: hypothetical protein VF540_10670 [Segetibacter sp.]|jgi:hypothetical protein